MCGPDEVVLRASAQRGPHLKVSLGRPTQLLHTVRHTSTRSTRVLSSGPELDEGSLRDLLWHRLHTRGSKVKSEDLLNRHVGPRAAQEGERVGR